MMRKIVILLACMSVQVGAKPCDVPYSNNFISGKYEYIARKPDSTETSIGTATIQAGKQGLQMIEITPNHTKRIWQGQFRAANPGDGCVLELVSAPYIASCLVTVDLDNNARLTCRWGWKDKATKAPGVAALFPVT